MDDDEAGAVFVRRADEVLRETCEVARSLIHTHQAAITLMVPGDWAQARKYFSLSEKYAAWREFRAPAQGIGTHGLVITRHESFRLTQDELVHHPAWRNFAATAATHPPMRGWLAVPLVGDDEQTYGLLQLSDKVDGSEFSERDERDLRSLARIAELGLSALGREREAAQPGTPFVLSPAQVTRVGE